MDLLRGLAALGVLLFHARIDTFVEFRDLPADQQTVPVALLYELTRFGRMGVVAFFVLSGFLVGGQIITRLRSRSFSVSDYAVDRSSRILLPLIPACLFTEAINLLVFHRPVRLLNLFGSMCGLNDLLVSHIAHNAPLWTLTYEIWFYVACGACAVLVSGGRKGTRISALVIAGLCLIVFSRLDARYLLYWVAGAFLVLYLDIGKQKYFWIAGIVLGVAAIAMRLPVWGSPSLLLALVPVSDAALVIGLCSVLPALCDPRFDRKIQFLRPFATAISAFSFSLYLIYGPIIAVVDLFFPTAPAITAASLTSFLLRTAAGLTAGIVFYWMFERNTYRVRRYLKSRLPTVAQSVELARGNPRADRY